jgi:hypothetical protein
MLSSKFSTLFRSSTSDSVGLSIGYGKHLWEIRAVTITRVNLLVVLTLQMSKQHRVTLHSA